MNKLKEFHITKQEQIDSHALITLSAPQGFLIARPKTKKNPHIADVVLTSLFKVICLLLNLMKFNRASSNTVYWGAQHNHFNERE